MNLINFRLEGLMKMFKALAQIQKNKKISKFLQKILRLKCCIAENLIVCSLTTCICNSFSLLPQGDEKSR